MKRLGTIICLMLLAVVNAFAQGGIINPPSLTVCSGSNSYTLTLSGQLGTINGWESSTDGGNNWTNTGNTSITHTVTNAISPGPAPNNTILYRVEVQPTIGQPVYSTTTTVTFDLPSDAGIVAGTATVCVNSNSGTLTASSYTGTITHWASSTNGGVTWTNISNTTASQNYNNLSNTTIYQVYVQSGTCSADSAAATITTAPPSVGGTTAGTATVCSGSNSGNIILTGHTGSIQWQYSTNGGSSWTNTGNSNDTLSYLNLVSPSGTTTYLYHAIVQSGTCAPATSSTVAVTVTPSPNAGTLSGIATVCETSNSGSVNLSGYNGAIIYWQSSTGSGWDSIPNTTATVNYNNLDSSTQYHAVVQLGSCVAFSNNVTITVNPASVGGSLTATNDTVCSGTNSGVLTLNGKTGGVKEWQHSVNAGGPWLPLGANTDTFQLYSNLTSTTYYQVVVQSGVCPTTVSSMYTVTVDPQSDGGVLESSATVCVGSNSGTITLKNFTGSSINWQYSTDTASGWLGMSNTLPTWNYLNLTDTTWYRAIVKSGVCPADTSTIAVIATASMPVADAGTNASISLGYSVQLNGNGGTSYAWAPSEGLNNAALQNPVASPTETTTYTLTVTDANGCTDESEVTVEVLADHKFLLTNLITPNGDGKNDTWYIGNIEEYPLCEVSIFNIYNTKLFTAMPYANDWDGTFNGKELPDGTYYYIIKCPDAAQESKGYITLLRNK